MVKQNYNTKSNSKFVNLSKYPVRTNAENKLIRKDPFGDKDRDKVPNMMDCKPLDKKKQNFGGLLGGLLAVAITAEVAGNIMRRSNERNKNYPKNKNKFLY
jgi:hypothetical protein